MVADADALLPSVCLAGWISRLSNPGSGIRKAFIKEDLWTGQLTASLELQSDSFLIDWFVHDLYFIAARLFALCHAAQAAQRPHFQFPDNHTVHPLPQLPRLPSAAAGRQFAAFFLLPSARAATADVWSSSIGSA